MPNQPLLKPLILNHSSNCSRCRSHPGFFSFSSQTEIYLESTMSGFCRELNVLYVSMFVSSHSQKTQEVKKLVVNVSQVSDRLVTTSGCTYTNAYNQSITIFKLNHQYLRVFLVFGSELVLLVEETKQLNEKLISTIMKIMDGWAPTPLSPKHTVVAVITPAECAYCIIIMLLIHKENSACYLLCTILTAYRIYWIVD